MSKYKLVPVAPTEKELKQCVSELTELFFREENDPAFTMEEGYRLLRAFVLTTAPEVNPWVSVKERQIPKNYEGLLMYASGIIVTGQKRYGYFGEPSQDQHEWRATCCGRFATPTHWWDESIMPIPKPKEGK